MRAEDPLLLAYHRERRKQGHQEQRPFLLEYKHPEGSVFGKIAADNDSVDGWMIWSRFGALEIARDAAQRQKMRPQYKMLSFQVVDTRTGEVV